MKVTSYAVARPAYYDRTSVGSTNQFNSTVAPHSPTTRFTYTVASGRKAVVELSRVYLGRASVATTAGLHYIQLAAGGATIAYVDSVTNSTATYQQVINSLQFFLYASETIVAETADSSTGGTVTFTVASKATVFDA